MKAGDHPSSETTEVESVHVNIRATSVEKEKWTEEAEEMGYNARTRYLQAMVNAGRREFGLTDEEDQQTAAKRTITDLKSRVYANLSTHKATAFDDLIEIITAEIEDEIEESLDELAEEEKIEYKPRGGVIRSE